MKTMIKKTGSLFIILVLTGLITNLSAQNTKLTRKELKEARKTALVMNYYILDSLLNARTFVLEADVLKGQYGDIVNVMKNINFIKVDEDKGVLQTGTSMGQGYNGVGGVTAEGSIETWKVYKNPKSLSYTVQFSLNTSIGHYDILMNVSSNTRATATITGLTPGRLTWEGHLVTLDNARVFKGMNII